MNKVIAVQFFAVLAIAIGCAVSYYPPPSNGAAIWALVSGFLGYGVRDLFADQIDQKNAGGAGQAAPADKQGGYATLAMLLALASVALLLGGCSLMPAAWSQVEEGAAQTIVQSSERAICRDIPIGTWIRLYGTNADRVKGWQALCFNPVTAPLNDATVAAILKLYPGFQQAVEAGTLPPVAVPPVPAVPK